MNDANEDGVKGAFGRSVRVFMTSMNVASYVLWLYNTTTITTGACTYHMPSVCVCERVSVQQARILFYDCV